MNKFQKIELKNIANFSDTTINLTCCEDENIADIHIFVGKNGAGKTVILNKLADGNAVFKGIFPIEDDVDNLCLLNKKNMEIFSRFVPFIGNVTVQKTRKRIFDWLVEILGTDNRCIFIDDIELHLDIETQRRILPAIQTVLKGYQIFVSTHSPFVAGSIGKASIYKINPNESEINATPARLGRSYECILEEFFGVNSEFDCYTESLFKQFQDIRHDFLKYPNDDNTTRLKSIFQKFLPIIENSEYVEKILASEVRQIERITGIDVSNLFYE